jgi:hypothetical protein
MDGYLLTLIALVLCVLAAVLLLIWEVRRLRSTIARAGQGDPCWPAVEIRMQCVERRLQELDRRL